MKEGQGRDTTKEGVGYAAFVILNFFDGVAEPPAPSSLPNSNKGGVRVRGSLWRQVDAYTLLLAGMGRKGACEGGGVQLIVR